MIELMRTEFAAPKRRKRRKVIPPRWLPPGADGRNQLIILHWPFLRRLLFPRAKADVGDGEGPAFY